MGISKIPHREAESTNQLEELFQEEIPCGVLGCGRSALLVTSGHSCRPPGWQGFLCFPCWKRWYDNTRGIIDRCGHVRHDICGVREKTVDGLSTYLEF